MSGSRPVGNGFMVDDRSYVQEQVFCPFCWSWEALRDGGTQGGQGAGDRQCGRCGRLVVSKRVSLPNYAWTSFREGL